MKLELKYLAGYLPYELNIVHNYITSRIERGDPLELHKTKMEHLHLSCFFRNDKFDYKPILRPLSDLTKEIEINGEKFVPIIELAKIAGAYINEKMIACERKIYKLLTGISSANELHFLVETTNMGTLHYQFTYDEESHRFSLRDNSTRRPLSFINQLELFEFMYKHHFDIHGLIKENLAININDL